ncbi:MAG: exo-beta-1,4-galactosidase [Arcticibacter sp.]
MLFALVFTASAKADVINLEGTWRFGIDRDDKGITEKWFSRNLEDAIRLPGSMAENLKGDPITLQTKWTGSIYDSSYYFNPRLEKYRRSDNIHIPFWLTPARHYVGAAWYQKEVVIPAKWKGQCIILNLERAHTETRVWIDDQELGTQNSLAAPHIYELRSGLEPGKHRITIRVDNRIKEINVGPDSHSVSDHTQGNWNGIVGRMFLESRPQVYLEDIRVFPDVKNKKALVRLFIANTSGSAVKGQIKLVARSFNSEKSHETKTVQSSFNVARSGNTSLDVEVPFGDGMLTWDEFNPALYKLSAILQARGAESEKEVQFGMREFRIEGNQFLINGNPVFLRGTLHNAEFPLTGYPDMKVEGWLRIFRTAKQYGLNHVRFHSWCPPEAAFIAADQVGIFLQPEAPSWPNHGPKIGLGQPIDKYLYDETARMIKSYGNYASYTMHSAGNEPAGNQVQYLNDFVAFWKKQDNRRVYTGMSVGGSWPIVPQAEYQVRGGVRGLAWDKRPESFSDFSEGIAKFKVPFVAHEMGQWCVFPNFDEIKKYKGVYRARNFEMFQQDLQDQGMGDQARDFFMASGKLQALSYKHEIEKSLRTPGYGGFQLLGLQDFPGQGTALVGLIDAFWEGKDYVSPEQFSRFCNTTVPLARLPKFVFYNNERFQAQIDLFRSEKNVLLNGVVRWRIKNAGGKILKSGSFAPQNFRNGNGIKVGSIDVSLAEVDQPSRLNLEVAVDKSSFINDWDFWVYPASNPREVPGIYYTSVLDNKAKEVLNRGGKVFFNAAGKVVKGKEVQMYFLPVFWNTSWFKMRPPHVTGMLIQEKSPAFDDFPTSYHSDLQWWDIQHRSQTMILEDFPAGFKPLIQPIDTWFLNRRLALVYEARVGKGKIIVSSADLRKDADDRPAAEQLFYSLQKYMASEKFNPSQEVDINVIEDVFKSPSKQLFDTYTKDSPDELKPSSSKNKVN